VSINKPPAFQFYPSEFVSDFKVIMMNMEERGAYITLLSHEWLERGLPNNQDELKALCGNPKNWQTIWKKVGQCFYEKKGKLFNKRLEKERKKIQVWKKKSREGGIKSGESRRGKVEPKANHPSTKSEPKGNTLTSSLTPSLNNKNEEEELCPNTKYSDVDIELSSLLIEGILKNNPRAKAGKLTEKQKESWYNQCRLLRESGWSPDEIRTVIEYTQQDEFEIPNVQSMGKLRERFDNLALKARREIAKKTGERDVGRQKEGI